MITTLRRVWFFLDSRTRMALAGLLALMLVSALGEMVSLTMILPLARLVFGTGADNEWIAGAKQLTGLSGFPFIAATCAAFGILFIGKNAAIFVIQYVVNRFTMTRLARFQTRLLRHYLERPYVSRLDDHSAILLRNVTSAASAAFDALQAFLNIMLEVILISAVTLTLAMLQPALALAGLVGFGLLGVTYYLLTGVHLERLGAQSTAATGEMLKWAVQGIASIKDIKVLGCAAYFETRFGRQAAQLARIRTLRQMSQMLPRAVVEAVLVIVMLIGMLALYSDHAPVEDLMGTIGLVGLVVLRTLPSLNRLLGLAGEIRQFGTEVGVLYAELTKAPEDDGVNPGITKGATPLSFAAAIELHRVGFAYGSDGGAALAGIDLAIHRGEAIGIIGPSGSGKSTLLDVLLGLLPPTDGRMTVDGIDVYTHVAAWRANIGFVPQSIYLLDDTIRRNIAFGLPDDLIDDAAVARALTMARLDDLVATLPDGVETMVGEGGARLSGGQRQRIGIARALYRDPDVLLFDEATSALDGETEREVVAAIDALKDRKTLVIVAHRLSTVAHCHRIYRLDGGHVVDQGTLAEVQDRQAASAAATQRG